MFTAPEHVRLSSALHRLVNETATCHLAFTAGRARAARKVALRTSGFYRVTGNMDRALKNSVGFCLAKECKFSATLSTHLHFIGEKCFLKLTI